MTGIKGTDFADSGSDAGGADPASESKSGQLDAVSCVFVALDAPSLPSPVASVGYKNSTMGALSPFQNTLSRKGSQRGGERKMVDIAAPAAAAAADGENPDAVIIHVAGEGDAAGLHPATTITDTRYGGGSRCRSTACRRPSRWLNPRRVLVFFASLSSMGTLILLYFTLSMGKVPGGDSDAR